MRALSQGIVLATMIMLMACTTTLPVKENDLEARWQQRQVELMGLVYWQFKARSSIRQDKESWQAGLRWQQSLADYEVQVLGPFSMGGLVLKGDDQQVILTLADGQQWQATAPEGLLEKTTGWKLPVSALRHWVRGLSATNLPLAQKTLDDQAQIITMVQGEWRIKFPEYMKVKNQTLPRKIFVENGELHLKMVIDKWQLGQ